MANGFGSLYIGASGLQNSQNALNTTSNNLANVNTKGYVRQQVLQVDRNYTTFNTTASISQQQSGLGMKIGDVVHARDIFLDKSYRNASGRQAFYAATYEAVDGGRPPEPQGNFQADKCQAEIIPDFPRKNIYF